MRRISHLLNNRYQLGDQIGSGGMGTVYRALDRLTGQTVALKRVHLANDVRVALAQEFKTLASLRHPNIVSVLDYGFVEDGQPYFTMELLEGAKTLTEAGQNILLRTKTTLLLQILQALSYLHRRGVIHRDLKPGNVLVLNEQVKVVDFGLAITRADVLDEVAGTLGYLAPEILRSNSTSEKSDLYSVGVMAYELFAGHHPFSVQNPTLLIDEVLNKSPDISELDVQEPLALMVTRLLHKNPEERHPSANEVISVLLDTFGDALPVETQDIRDSFLQAAEFVGREAEMQMLTNALKNAVQGQGSSWLVGGESGVGKSRLLDELRTLALVEGFIVLRGQGESAGHISYQLWREPVRRLMLSTELAPLEQSILKEIVPDIETLLEAKIPDAPELDGKGQQQRLVLTIVDLFRKQTRPLLLLVENLQWVHESLEPLKHLIRIVDHLPLLIIGSYRSEETPHLPEVLPEMRVLKLERLTPEAIATLSVSMLGDAGQHPHVIDLLSRETEGNTFFIIEVIRSLVEEYGSLDQIGVVTLPSKVISGGVQAVIQRRLSRVPSYAMTLLKQAAIIGRQLDLTLLGVLATDVDLEKWLADCADIALIEVVEEKWRFSHDQLRDALLESIPENERSALYHQVAAAAETFYSQNATYAASLSEYWYVAGETEKSAYYACRAAEQAINLSKYPEASSILHRVLQSVTSDALSMQILSLLGDASWRTGNYAEAKTFYQRGLKLATALNETPVMADILNGLAMVSYMVGESQQATHYAQEAMEVAYENGHQKNTARALNTLGMVAEFDGNLDTAIRYYGQGLQIFKTIEDQRGTASALNNLGTVADSRGELDKARTYYEESLEICKRIGYRQGISALLNNLGVVAERLHDFPAADRYYRESLDLASQIGNRRGRTQALANLVFTSIAQGKIEEAKSMLQQAIQLLGKDDVIVIPHVLAGLAHLKLADRDTTRSAEIAGLIKSLTNVDADFLVTRFNPLFDRLRTVLTEQEINAAMERGTSLSVETVFQGSL